MMPLPAGIVDRARAHLRGEIEPVVPRDAATVALVRDGAHGIEVYLLRRVAAMAFAGGMHVFPGGSVDARDSARCVGWAGPDPREWTVQLRCDDGRARALVCAAVRETFEESGVLLAGPSDTEVVEDPTGRSWEADRAALVAGELALGELLTRRSLVLRSDLLKPWAHWVTPEFEPRRYDTRFFVAAVPAGQRCREVGGEADRVLWLPARTAVEDHERGTLAMLPPTVVTLRELSVYDTVGQAMRADRRLAPIMPRAVTRGGELALEWD